MEAPKLFGVPMTRCGQEFGAEEVFSANYGALYVFVRQHAPDSWGWTGSWGLSLTGNTPLYLGALDVANACECAEACVRNIWSQIGSAIETNSQEGDEVR